MPPDRMTTVVETSDFRAALSVAQAVGAIVSGEERIHELPARAAWSGLPSSLGPERVAALSDWPNEILFRLVERPAPAPVVSVVSEGQSPAWNRLRARLHTAFLHEPFTEGEFHPAEEILSAALATDATPLLLESLRDYCLNAPTPSFAVETLRCLGRLASPGTSRWRVELIRDALRRPEVRIRDAALQATEGWEDRTVVPVLRSHRESEDWLRGYLNEIIGYLAG